MSVPSVLTAKASVSFTASTPTFDASDGYSGLIEFRSEGAGFDISSASSSGTTHTFTVAAASAAWTAGRYAWQLSAVKSGEKWIVATGETEVRPDFASASNGLDARTHIRKVLDAVEAVIERRATQSMLDMAIPSGDSGMIALKRVPLADLMKLRDTYRRELRSLETAANLAAGRGNRRLILTRFQ